MKRQRAVSYTHLDVYKRQAIGSPERLDLRSYARQGIDKIPTVHMGPAVSQLEKKGIQTNIGNLNRDIKAANSLMPVSYTHLLGSAFPKPCYPLRGKQKTA